MSILNDGTISFYGTDLIEPFRPERVQPASYDLALGDEFIVFDEHEDTVIDLADVQDNAARKVKKPDKFVLHPGEFVLGVTEEIVRIPSDLVARLEGKSSIGRIGLLIHVTAGFVDPGWDGRLTLEIYNVRRKPIILRPGKPFCQISFQRMETAAEKPYTGRYQGATSVDATRYGRGVAHL